MRVPGTGPGTFAGAADSPGAGLEVIGVDGVGAFVPQEAIRNPVTTDEQIAKYRLAIFISPPLIYFIGSMSPGFQLLLIAASVGP